MSTLWTRRGLGAATIGALLLALNGCGAGGGCRTGSVFARWFTLEPGQITVPAGNARTVTVRAGRDVPTFTLGLVGAPAGMSIAAIELDGGETAEAGITVGAAVAPGTYAVIVRGAESPLSLLRGRGRSRQFPDGEEPWGLKHDEPLTVVVVAGDGSTPAPTPTPSPTPVPSGGPGGLLLAANQETAGGPATEFYRLFRTDGDGGNPIAVSGPLPFAQGGSLSADGSRMVYVRSAEEGGRRVFVANTDGTNEQQVDPDGVSPLQYVPADPAFSPDGSKIVFLNSGQNRIAIMNVDGTGFQYLTAAGSFRQPTFRPDGQQIALIASDQVAVMNTDGTGLTARTSGDGQKLQPRYSPDGSKIVYWQSVYVPGVRTDENVGIVDTTGGNQRLLTTDNQSRWPIFRQNGRIVFVQGDNALCTIGADGSGKQTLAASFPGAFLTLLDGR